jgi:exodeoxyribonuclease VII large subunit
MAMAGQLDLALGEKRGAGSANALTVTQLVRMVREALEARFDECWVVGEISNARIAPSNHLYFTLKDPNAAINVVMFSSAARRLRFKATDGMQVLVRGRVNVYETRGALQFYAEEMEPRGVGALQVAFEQLKRRLEAEGLFDAARKRPLPFMPRVVGIVTALRGAGLGDMMRVLFERFPNLGVIVRPARVQGDAAPAEIAEAIEDLNRDGRAEVIIVGRGGGSLEDLLAFNDETVARAIYGSRVPVVSAVGHEVDYTIADFVADRRAPTPTFAAQMVVPAKSQLSADIRGLARGLESSMRNAHVRAVRALEHLAARVRLPRAMLRDTRQRLDEADADLAQGTRRRVLDSRRRVRELATRLRPPTATVAQARVHTPATERALANAIGGPLARRRQRLGELAARLGSLSPLACLERGYAVVTTARDGRVVFDADAVAIGEELEIRLRRGRIRARTERREV